MTLLERLRDFPQFYRSAGGAMWLKGTGREPLCLEAADRIESLEATIREQEEQIADLKTRLTEF